jgi:hypothetical protein
MAVYENAVAYYRIVNNNPRQLHKDILDERWSWLKDQQ